MNRSDYHPRHWSNRDVATDNARLREGWRTLTADEVEELREQSRRVVAAQEMAAREVVDR